MKGRNYMFFLKVIFSIRLWNMFAIAVAIGLTQSQEFKDLFLVLIQNQVELVPVFLGSIMACVAFFSLVKSYSISSIKEFRNDTFFDVIVLLLAVCTITYVYGLELGDDTLPLTLLAISGGFAAFDFLFSLVAGSAKLERIVKKQE